LISNSQLREIFKISTCLGFTIWQHFAAVERLNESYQWQNLHQETWASIRQGRDTVGLGITHIAKAGPPALSANLNPKNDYLVNGHIPWISGFGHFDHFIVGFSHQSNTVIAIIPAHELSKFSVFSRYELATLNGTRTGSLAINNLVVPSKYVLSITPEGTPTRKTSTQYKNPELGLADQALEKAKELIESGATNPRLKLAIKTLELLHKKIESFQSVSQNPSLDQIELTAQRDLLIHECMRFLTIVEGGNALSATSFSSLLWSQVRLLDVFVQPQNLIRLKLENLGR
jgi:DNA-binding XRE family transcriptional regulator